MNGTNHWTEKSMDECSQTKTSLQLLLIPWNQSLVPVMPSGSLSIIFEGWNDYGKRKIQRQLWDDDLRWVCGIENRTSIMARELGGECPHQKVTGKSVNISKLGFSKY